MCPHCSREATGKKTYCSNSCKSSASRKRKKEIESPRKASTVTIKESETKYSEHDRHDRLYTRLYEAAVLIAGDDSEEEVKNLVKDFLEKRLKVNMRKDEDFVQNWSTFC